MDNTGTLLNAIGGDAGCMQLSAEFYRRVGKDPVLKPLFPGKSLRCATEEFAAFLIQFLGGDEAQTQKRWWLSLRESHARFRISPEQRAAWLRHMSAALDAGMNLVDTADVYGLDWGGTGFGTCEERLGHVLRQHPSLRERMVLAYAEQAPRR